MSIEFALPTPRYMKKKKLNSQNEWSKVTHLQYTFSMTLKVQDMQTREML